MKHDPARTPPAPRLPDHHRPFAVQGAIALGLLLWGTMLALGAYRFNHNPWRLVVVLGCVLGFLAFWGLLLFGKRLSPLRRTLIWSLLGVLAAGGLTAFALRLDAALRDAPLLLHTPSLTLKIVAGLLVVAAIICTARAAWRARR